MSIYLILTRIYIPINISITDEDTKEQLNKSANLWNYFLKRQNDLQEQINWSCDVSTNGKNEVHWDPTYQPFYAPESFRRRFFFFFKRWQLNYQVLKPRSYTPHIDSTNQCIVLQKFKQQQILANTQDELICTDFFNTL